MNKQDAIEELERIADECAGDIEGAHMDADQVLCDILVSMGHEDVVEAWKAIEKWYA